ncbi:MAG: MMPL family transporter [Myxococcota bacterium]|nr:MMPL family transporter [Myxococcota bacterium]
MFDVDSTLSGPLRRWVGGARRRAVATLLLCGAATLVAGGYAATNLGVDSDTIELFPEHLPARQNHDAFVALFPDLENALLIVVDGDRPEASRAAAHALVKRLSADTAHFDDVYLPGGGRFFERHALLYQDVDELDEFGDRFARAQPVIAELERDPSLANLAFLIRQGFEQIEAADVDAGWWIPVLDRIGEASVEIYSEHAVGVSWAELMVEGSAVDANTRRVVLAHPVLDFADALPARAPLAALREAASEVRADHDGVVIRVTGNPALVYEETLSIVWDIGVSGVFCLLLVTGILMIALRSGALVGAVVTTLLTGLVWTAGFAAVAVGNLNVISVAAGVLFLGLGVDFGLHLGMRYADLRRGGDAHAAALDQAARSVGGSLVLCTLTTAIGFFAFLPTDYRGVAELGLITGVGLIIILFLTLTLLPALLTVGFRVDGEALQGRVLRFGEGPSRVIAANARAICAAAAVLGGVALVVVPNLRFDANIVAMRDPSTESVQTFNDLLADAGHHSPWYANSVVANLEEADRLKREMSELDVVARSITLSDYIPDEQEEKLEVLGDLAFLLASPGADAKGTLPAPTPEEQLEALRDLHALLNRAVADIDDAPLAASIRDLQSKLAALIDKVDRREVGSRELARFESVLLSSIPEQIERVRRALDPEPIDREALPARLTRRLVAPDGRARVQTFPKENLEDHEAFERFVAAVQRVDPNVTGIAVNLIEFARTTKLAFRQAIAMALGVIAVLLFLLWRNPKDMALVLVPLLLAGLVTGAVMVGIDLPLNFFNVVVVPLLMGAGVDSGIHLVEQSRRRKANEIEVLGTTTARAVLFSALTTITSFGSLALSSHVGLAGLGTLLTVGMTLTVMANLVLLPAMLQRVRREPSRTN